ncbi:MFS transporter [Tabrizicola piscis]|uniref:MFS transporter n=1 Tax=Tabrizicola piscis TaxID=2494374 RepID=A0A3S8U4D5_9RHOB|nr:MFS transporter [Tabrizicola piscis]AZL58457.1 MFS transporter [Tabrizicola piscis]
MTALQRFIAASAVTNLADGVAVVAWAWVASLLTRDALLVALVPVALRLPWFLLALPAGVITDRVDRRWLILRMDALRGVAFAGAALAIWAALPLAPAPAEWVSAPWLYASLVLAAFVVGGAEVFRDNAAQTMLPAFVPPDRLERANGQLWSAELLTNALIGPALGAVLIAAWLPLAFGVNAVAYGLALLLVAGVAGQFRPERTDPRNWRVELGEGLGFLRGKPLLRTLAWTTGFWNLFHQMIVIGVVLHAQENLGLSATAYGLTLAGGALGGIAGSLMGERISRALGPARTMQWMVLASGPCFAAMALAPNAVTLALCFAAMEFSGFVWNVVSVSTRQRMIPDALRGRVNSLYRLLAWGMMPLGLLLSGVTVTLAEAMLPRDLALTLPFWVAGLGSILLSLVVWRAIQRGFAPHQG